MTTLQRKRLTEYLAGMQDAMAKGHKLRAEIAARKIWYIAEEVWISKYSVQ